MQGSGFKVWGLGFKVWALRCMVQGSYLPGATIPRRAVSVPWCRLATLDNALEKASLGFRV